MESTMTMTSLKPKPMRPKSPYLPHSLNSRRIFKSLSLPNPSVGAPSLVDQFDPTIPIERAVTPPSSWYTDPSFYAQELDSVFYRGWQAVGYTEQIKNPGDFFTGRLGSVEFVVCRDEHGKLQAFHNVCRHHASILAYGSGRKSCFVCPYHGWTYGLDGALLKATRITGIQNFNKHEFGLTPVKVVTWGPFVLANMEPEVDCDVKIVESEWLGSSSDVLSKNGVDPSLSYVCRREYTIECNWKFFCDNYLDGGYHVPYAHKGLVSGLNLDGRIGLAMGKQATEVVKESSDIIVLDGNFATVAKGFRWGRSMHEKVLRVMQQQLTANSVAVTINCLVAVYYRHIPLNTVQFVWVNVIIFGLGPLVLATESPADDLMNVPPIDRGKPLIKYIRWRRLLIEVLYQIIALIVINFQGGSLLKNYTRGHATKVKNTMIFNTFVICQISIEFGVRKTGIVDHPLKWITANSVFLGIVGIILVIQLIIIEFLGKAFFIVRLDWKEWQFSLTLGIVEFLFIVTPPLPDASKICVVNEDDYHI